MMPQSLETTGDTFVLALHELRCVVHHAGALSFV